MGIFEKNYHTHTVRCHHASGGDEEYISAAISAGIKVLGFSDHTPYPCDFSGYRMGCEDMPNYFESLTALKEKYKDKIEILIGLETEYYENHFDELLEYYKTFPIDYIILGQHFYDYDGKRACTFHETDDKSLLALYFDDCIKGLESGCFTYMAHPDALNFTGDPAVYHEFAEKLCHAAKKCRVPLELNLQGYEMGRPYPRDTFWQVAGEVGCDVIIGADAHSPDAILRSQKNYAEVVERFVKRHKLKLIDTPILRKPEGK